MARHDVPHGRLAVYRLRPLPSLSVDAGDGGGCERKRGRGATHGGEAHGSSGRLTHGLCSGGSDEILMTRNAEFALKQGAGSLFHLKSERLPSGAVERRAPS